MSDVSRPKRRAVPLPPALSTPSAAPGEAAPVEAVRAIAALLGRAALPGSATSPTSDLVARAETHLESEDEDKATLRGDREIPITGGIAALSDDAYDAVRDARKRQRRATKHVHEVLERLSSDVPEGLST